jgi:hypothetical protein
MLHRIPNAKVLIAAPIVTAAAYAMNYIRQREHKVIGQPAEVDKDGLIVNHTDLLYGKRPVHGSLPSLLCVHANTGKTYVQKSASGRKALIHEYMTANFLHAVNPNQPKSLISQKHLGADAQFFTLSEVPHPSTVDIEEFVRANRSHEMSTSKIIGLAEMLISDQLLGKQFDLKLANLIVSTYLDGQKQVLVFATIDHELGFSPINCFNSGAMAAPLDPAILVNAVLDTKPADDNNQSGLAGSSMALEWRNIAIQKITKDDMQKAYQRIGEADTADVISKCHVLAIKTHGLFKSSDCDLYKVHFQKIQAEARLAAKNLEKESEQQARLFGRMD